MTEPQWLNPEERRAWLAVASLMFRLPATLESQLQRDEDLTVAGYMVLAMLSESATRECRMSKLAELTNTSQSRLSRIVARLEKDGYVTRAMDANDRRVVLARITEAGIAKIAAAAPCHVAAVRAAVFDRLDEEQVRQLAAISRTLLGADFPHLPE
jgi:DNA-binding MarR family transcriptional regulator